MERILLVLAIKAACSLLPIPMRSPLAPGWFGPEDWVAVFVLLLDSFLYLWSDGPLEVSSTLVIWSYRFWEYVGE